MTNHSLLAAGVGAALFAALPVTAAETIFFDYGYASRSLPVSTRRMGKGLTRAHRKFGLMGTLCFAHPTATTAD